MNIQSKPKPKRIRTRPGKTPAIMINWTEEEDIELKRLVHTYGEKSFHRICKHMPYKTEIRCHNRWFYFKAIQAEKNLNPIEKLQLNLMGAHSVNVIPNLPRSQWDPEEDRILREKVNLLGTQNWVVIAKYLPGRLGRQCRERWHNVLNPNIVRKNWTRVEDEFILQQFADIGSKWSQISKMGPLVGRTVSQIKNRYYQNLKGKDLDQIRYIEDDPNEQYEIEGLHSTTKSIVSFKEEDNISQEPNDYRKRDYKSKEKEKQRSDLFIHNFLNDYDHQKLVQAQSHQKLNISARMNDNILGREMTPQTLDTLLSSALKVSPQSEIKRPASFSQLSTANNFGAFKNIQINRPPVVSLQTQQQIDTNGHLNKVIGQPINLNIQNSLGSYYPQVPQSQIRQPAVNPLLAQSILERLKSQQINTNQLSGQVVQKLLTTKELISKFMQ